MSAAAYRQGEFEDKELANEVYFRTADKRLISTDYAVILEFAWTDKHDQTHLYERTFYVINDLFASFVLDSSFCRRNMMAFEVAKKMPKPDDYISVIEFVTRSKTKKKADVEWASDVSSSNKSQEDENDRIRREQYLRKYGTPSVSVVSRRDRHS
jgi:hypothetical protein